MAATQLFAQQEELATDLNIEGVFVKKYQNYPKGYTFKLSKVVDVKSGGKSNLYLVMEEGSNSFALPLDRRKIINLTASDVNSFWPTVFINHGMFEYFDKRGFNYAYRNELQEEVQEYLEELANANLFYEDVWVEDYVQQVFAEISPKNLHARFPEMRGIRILKSPSPDSYMLPDGTFMLTTGLLSVLDSREELVAMMASEFTHYVLDHHIANILKASDRVDKAVMWSILLGGVALVADEVLAYKKEYYIPGTLSLSAAMISDVVFTQASHRMGMNYPFAQKELADNIAKEYLRYNEMDTTALASALTKIKTYYESRKDFYPLSEEGAFYQVNKRILALGEISSFDDRNYKRNMAGVTTFNAISQLLSKDYGTASWFINKNIGNRMAVDEDYIIAAKVNMGLYNTPQKNKESLELVERAIQMSSDANLNAYKQRIIALMRLNRSLETRNAIDEYIDLLKTYQGQEYTVNEAEWILGEITWATNLKNRYAQLTESLN